MFIFAKSRNRWQKKYKFNALKLWPKSLSLADLSITDDSVYVLFTNGKLGLFAYAKPCNKKCLYGNCFYKLNKPLCWCEVFWTGVNCDVRLKSNNPAIVSNISIQNNKINADTSKINIGVDYHGGYMFVYQNMIYVYHKSDNFLYFKNQKYDVVNGLQLICRHNNVIVMIVETEDKLKLIVTDQNYQPIDSRFIFGSAARNKPSDCYQYDKYLYIVFFETVIEQSTVKYRIIKTSHGLNYETVPTYGRTNQIPSNYGIHFKLCMKNMTLYLAIHYYCLNQTEKCNIDPVMAEADKPFNYNPLIYRKTDETWQIHFLQCDLSGDYIAAKCNHQSLMCIFQNLQTQKIFLEFYNATKICNFYFYSKYIYILFKGKNYALKLAYKPTSCKSMYNFETILPYCKMNEAVTVKSMTRSVYINKPGNKTLSGFVKMLNLSNIFSSNFSGFNFKTVNQLPIVHKVEFFKLYDNVVYIVSLNKIYRALYDSERLFYNGQHILTFINEIYIFQYLTLYKRFAIVFKQSGQIIFLHKETFEFKSRIGVFKQNYIIYSIMEDGNNIFIIIKKKKQETYLMIAEIGTKITVRNRMRLNKYFLQTSEIFLTKCGQDFWFINNFVVESEKGLPIRHLNFVNFKLNMGKMTRINKMFAYHIYNVKNVVNDHYGNVFALLTCTLYSRVDVITKERVMYMFKLYYWKVKNSKLKTKLLIFHKTTKSKFCYFGLSCPHLILLFNSRYYFYTFNKRSTSCFS